MYRQQRKKITVYPITIEDIDEISGDILASAFPNIKTDSDKHDFIYTQIHNYLKEVLEPWREQPPRGCTCEYYNADEPHEYTCKMNINRKEKP